MEGDVECVIGTRSSVLARAQATEFQEALRDAYPALSSSLCDISTEADTSHAEVPLRQLGGEGVFTKALEEATLDGRVHLSVHSLKDVPTTLAPGLTLACVLPREDPSDVLLVPRSFFRNRSTTTTGTTTTELPLRLPPQGAVLTADQLSSLLPAGCVVGTSSVRRTAALQRSHPSLQCVGVRGNLQTRLRKVREGYQGLQALVLAAAGMRRLGLLPCSTEEAEAEAEAEAEDALLWWRLFGGAHAVGQAAIGVLCRAQDQVWVDRLHAMCDQQCWVQVLAERALMRGLQGGCSVPIMVQHGPEEGVLCAQVYSPDGAQLVEAHIRVPEDPEGAEQAGLQLAQDLLEAGAHPLLALAKHEFEGRVDSSQE